MKARKAHWKKDKEGIIQVEQSAFPEEMQSTEHDLKDTFKDHDSINYILEENNQIIGYVCAAPLEKKEYKHYKGVKEDENYGQKNTLYVESIAIRPENQSLKALKTLTDEFLSEAKKQGYKHLTHHTRTKNKLAETIMKKIGATKISSHHNWFGFGETFDYLRITL